MTTTPTFAPGGNIQNSKTVTSAKTLSGKVIDDFWLTPTTPLPYSPQLLPVTATPECETSSDAKRAFIRDHFAPHIRKLGWKGTGNNYSYDDPDYFINTNFQMTSNGAYHASTFYIKIQDKANWHKENGDKKYSHDYGDKLSMRIESPILDLPDQWNFYADTDLDAVEKMVFDALENHLFPRMFKKLELLRANPSKWIGTSVYR